MNAPFLIVSGLCIVLLLKCVNLTRERDDAKKIAQAMIEAIVIVKNHLATITPQEVDQLTLLARVNHSLDDFPPK